MRSRLIDSFFGLNDSNTDVRKVSLRALLSIWRERANSRKQLAALDDHQLADIGLTKAEARLESARSFWHGESAPYWHRIRSR